MFLIPKWVYFCKERHAVLDYIESKYLGIDSWRIFFSLQFTSFVPIGESKAVEITGNGINT